MLQLRSRSLRFIVAVLLALGALAAVPGCKASQRLRGCGCGMEERMGGRS